MSAQDATAAQVLEAVRAEIEGEGRVEPGYSLTLRVGRRLKIADLMFDKELYRHRLQGQVSRVLRKLAEQGVLVRSSEGSSFTYYTAEEYKRREAAKDQEAADRAAWLKRKNDITLRLAALGHAGPVESHQRGTISLSADALEWLLTAAESKVRGA